MTPHEAFLRAICENADDDAPRLMYADWLTEHGDPRGEFIRVQCQLTRMDEPDQYCEASKQREKSLLTAHGSTWQAELPQVKEIAWEGGFHRGFIESVRVRDVPTFASHAELIFSATPVRELRVREIRNVGDIETIVASPFLPRVRSLDLNGNPLGELGASILATAEHLAPLASLLVHRSALGDTGTRSLAGSGFLRRLRELYLSGNAITDEGVRALAASPALANLTELDLRDNLLTSEGAIALAKSKHLRRLVTLWLVNNRIGDGGVEAIAYSPNFSELCHLYLNHNQIDDAGVVALARSPYLGNLVELDLRNNRITDVGALAVAESPLAARLLKLDLGRNPLGWNARTALQTRLGSRVAV